MRDDPALVENACAKQQRKRRRAAAIIHRPSDGLHEVEQRPARIAKHLHLLARLGEVRRQRQIALARDSRRFRIQAPPKR